MELSVLNQLRTMHVVLLDYLFAMPRRAKRMIFLSLDTLLAPVSLYFAFALRYGNATDTLALIPVPEFLFAFVSLFGAATSFFLDLNRIKVRSIEIRAILRIGLCSLILAVLTSSASYLFHLGTPRSVPLIFGAVYFIGSVGIRLSALQILNFFSHLGNDRLAVVIYGAGTAGVQLASALKYSNEVKPVAFFDDNSHLHNLMVAGLPVYSPDYLSRLIAKKGVQRVLIAMPSAPIERQSELAGSLSSKGIEVQILPSVFELMSGQGLEKSLLPASLDALLGRDKVSFATPEIEQAYTSHIVMVTGAGGSIGSELCKQLVECQPAEIVLFENSEFALYSIEAEIRQYALGKNIKVHPVLGSVADAARVGFVISFFRVNTVLHAAAYKHVPLIESNEIEGARNNVLGTYILASAAAQAKVERFTLVSTDKAVRPTSVMGATKRLAEVVIQDIQERHPATKFSIVRFGNVLGSSGSVLPLFQKQIAAGGPVTVTDREVTRFFMTTPEAARLVLLAGSFSEGGDVFVLDMGKPRKIIDIAEQMILMAGRRVKHPGAPDGDIEIKITGLRPGEKLYEELLISGDSLLNTPNEKILRAEECKLSSFDTALMLREVRDAIDACDAATVRDRIMKWAWQANARIETAQFKAN